MGLGSPVVLEPAVNRVAGFRPDAVKGTDQLDIRREAMTLAMVLVHEDVEPPISVGLFGDWGSGKSFFMSEMRELIARLSNYSRDGGGRFCQNVVQLEFNAWHYMDSDLWASLAREIFEGLATAMADRENPDLNLERERLRVATRSTKDLIATTEAQVGEMQRRLAETERQLTTVEQARDSLSDVTRATVQAVLKTPEVERKLRTVAADLKLDDAGQNVGELKEQLDQLSKEARVARALAVGFSERWRGLLLGLLLVFVGAVVVYWITSRYAEDIAALMTRIAAIAGTVAALVATVGRAVQAALTRVTEFQRSLNENLERQREERTREIREQQAAFEEKRKRLEEQRAAQERELERLTKLSRELGRLDASRQLVDFIRQRDASSDYRAQLGTVARASQDFRRLSDLMTRAAAARKRQEAGQPLEGDDEDARLPRIDRIVLYIDDLDRCPERKVVDVLQAVHLLLAYPLFVVVVGVDPRWLLHSLEEHSRVFQASNQQGADDPTTGWRSTSLNYLEKIFQIPFTLRPMAAEGFRRLVDDLSATRQPTAAPGAPGPAVALPEEGTPLVAAPEPDELLDLNPAALELDDRERVFMAKLYELIPTPRAAKRFVNVYRLIRASITDPYELMWFLQAREFAAVQVLLAIVTGAPAESSEILRELLARPADGAWNTNWWDLVDAVVKPRLDRAGWQWLHSRLEPLRRDVEVPQTCEGFRKWADDVARYSFYSGRVLLEPPREQFGTQP